MTDPHHPPPAAVVAAMDVASSERLVRVETKLDMLSGAKASEHADMARDIADHEARIRSLEKAHWRSAGLAGGVAGLISGAAVLINALRGG